MSVDQTTQGIVLTEAAAAKVKALAAGEPEENLHLRIGVAAGGCSGLRYQLTLDDTDLEGDVAAEWHGVKVVTDRMSAPYLAGAVIDFMDTIEQQGFTIENPNAAGSCSCGDSFH
nr:iron-sulfur cluster assembly accessory protein [Propionibacterium sp.]